MSENTDDFSTNALVVISNEYTTTPIALAKSASNTIGDNDNAPRILCNELIINPNNSKSVEKLDELSSLEREIAKMHHVDDTSLTTGESSCGHSDDRKSQAVISDVLTPTSAVNDRSSGNKPSSQETSIEDKLDPITSGETALEHEDLIAVLKGLDGTIDEMHSNSVPETMLEGVTIEGEGEYQIMEVVDEDSSATEDTTKAIEGANSEPIIQSLNKTKTFGTTALTVQQERALALEQIEGLKIAHRRRKQDIKPIKQIDPALDLVSALEADWSEHDDEISETPKSKIKAPSNKIKVFTPTTCESKTKLPLVTNVFVIPSATTTVSSTPITSIASPEKTKVNISVRSSSSNSEEIKVNNESKVSPDEVIESKTEEDTQAISSQSGFRRTRIIKRKIIWDPDAPETTFSYAKLVKPSNSSKTKTEQMPTPTKKETSSAVVKTAKKTTRPSTPKAMKVEKSVCSLKNTVDKDVIKSENKTAEELHSAAIPVLENKFSPTVTSLPKKRSQTPVLNSPGSSAGVKKKKITEVDRLMGDEGAVNMLNSLEKLEATLGLGDAKSTRPMMRSRAATICEKLPRKDTTSPTQNTATTSPISTNPQTSKSKRMPKSRASSSWDYVYKKKKQDFEDSLIIRRRSNSSYSSTTSLNRLSLDGPPASIASNNNNNASSKCSDSISIPASTSEPKRLPSASNHCKSSGISKTRSTPTPPASKSFEFAKPVNKKSQKRTKSPCTTLTNDMKSAPVASSRNTRSPATTNEDKGKDVNKAISTKSLNNIKEKKDITPPHTSISDVVVKKSSKVAQIIFSTSKAKLSNTFTIQMLNKLVDILDKLASDPDCYVIVIGTNDAHFCQGIDITDLTTIADEKRKNYAANLATSAKNYLKTLATYPKPIVGGVSGNLINFGVIQLALFDVVIASDKTTFETPYCKMGQTPEGYCIWHNMNKIRGSFKTKLFWLCEKVQSTEAALAGLVNKLTSVNKVNDDALMTAKRIASSSVESYRVMKKTVVNSHSDVIANSLDDEFNAIIRQWTSAECLESLKKYIGQN